MKTMNVWLSDVPSLEVLAIYVKQAKERKIKLIYFDVPVPLSIGLERTHFYLKVSRNEENYEGKINSTITYR